VSKDIKQLEQTIADMQKVIADLAGHAFLTANPGGMARLSPEDFYANARIARQAIEDLKRAAG
jgi:hypothetical protein